MSIRKRLGVLAISLSLAGVVCEAHAGLVNQGDGTVKDTATSLIWLYDWNANGQPYAWQDDMDWADALVYAGASDWRLPTLDQYQTLWINAGGSATGLQSYFKNVELKYWSATEEFAPPSDFAWAFGTDTGVRDGDPKTRAHYAVAVRSGDVFAAPEPATLALAALGLTALGLTRRRRK